MRKRHIFQTEARPLPAQPPPQESVFGVTEGNFEDYRQTFCAKFEIYFAFSLAKAKQLCYNGSAKRITQFIRRHLPPLSDAPSAFGDKEIAVQIRGNSHYRNSPPAGGVKSECLSFCAYKRLLGKRRVAGKRIRAGYPFSRAPFGRVLLFYPSLQNKSKRKEE